MRIQQQLERGLAALAGAAPGNRAFTAQHLADFLDLVLPLLGSPLVGESAAFEAVRSLAECLPGVLGQHGLSVARALRLVELDLRGTSWKYSPPLRPLTQEKLMCAGCFKSLEVLCPPCMRVWKQVRASKAAL